MRGRLDSILINERREDQKLAKNVWQLLPPSHAQCKFVLSSQISQPRQYLNRIPRVTGSFRLECLFVRSWLFDICK